MTRAKRPTLALIISLLLLASVGVVIWKIPPLNWSVEAAVIMLLAISGWLAASWIVGKRKWATLLVLLLVVILAMNRWGILNWITLGLWISVVGLISLIN